MREIAMRDATDREILAGAAADGRVCVTLDKDFHEALDRSRATYPSVILLRWQKLRADGVAEVIDATLTRHAAELRSGVAITVSQRATRVRNLPLGPPARQGVDSLSHGAPSSFASDERSASAPSSEAAASVAVPSMANSAPSPRS